MAEARSVKWKTMREKKSFILLHRDADSLRHDAIAKNVFIDALEDKELPFVLWKEPKISRGSLQDCRKDGTLCEEGKACEDKDGFESKLKDLVTCSSFIVTLNQDCYN